MSGTKHIDHSGSSFDSFLAEEHLLEDAEAVAIKRVLAWQLQQAMKAKRVSKKGMAKQLQTSRSQVDRLLDPAYIGISLETVTRAAHAVGKRIQIQIVDVAPGRHNRSAKSWTKLTSKRMRSADRVAARTVAVNG